MRAGFNDTTYFQVALSVAHKHLTTVGNQGPGSRSQANFALTGEKLISQSGFSSPAKCLQNESSQTLEIKRFALSGY